MNKRNNKMKQWMNEHNIDLIMCQSRANVFYLTGFNTDPHERIVATFLFPQAKPFVICPNMEINQISEIYKEGEVIGYSDTEDPWRKIIDSCQLRKTSIKKIAIEQGISWQRFRNLQDIFPDADFVEVDEGILSQRIVKTNEEIVLLREAAKLADFGINVGVKALKEGITEMEVVAKIEYELKRKGIREMSFLTMVLFGEKCGDPHGNPGSRKLKKGDAILFDLGVVWNGYCSDITRTVFFDHVSKENTIIYETVLQAQQAALNYCVEGKAISNLDKAAREVITNNGYGDYFPHRIGHGLGIEVHEYPSLTESNNIPLKKGMTFTIEPGIYIPNQIGVRIEDDVLITEKGYELLTKFPKELTVIQ
ncbi:Xaa-Pro peptidase family protein [Evansella sp. AB-P1]|uniref:M24 family metallopeptidase n=1 Tax=Evansella sp. AB-P1 TaxID=3037653 RepID=UPI00241D55C8|nr:Xaa-Pro peptidase family protein [Evansella sp. AB-P1]MDG5786994.1 Xaa-Pro peptidase family protein [Evansella sp. AB-P1]